MLEWLLQHCDPDAWDKDYKDLFFGDPAKREREQAARARIAPSQKGQEGALNLAKTEAKPVADLSQFFGRAGGAGKADQNKEVMRERGKKRSPLTIGPDEDGNLSVRSDSDEG